MHSQANSPRCRNSYLNRTLPIACCPRELRRSQLLLCRLQKAPCSSRPGGHDVASISPLSPPFWQLQYSLLELAIPDKREDELGKTLLRRGSNTPSCSSSYCSPIPCPRKWYNDRVCSSNKSLGQRSVHVSVWEGFCAWAVPPGSRGPGLLDRKWSALFHLRTVRSVGGRFQCLQSCLPGSQYASC